MDREYVDFKRLYSIQTKGAFFVTRVKNRTRMKRRYSNQVDKTSGVLFDQVIYLTGVGIFDKYPGTFRQVKYRDEET